MKKLALLMIIGNVIPLLTAQTAFCSPSDVSLPDDVLMTFEVTYNFLPYTAALNSKTDVAGLGVEFDVGIGGFGETKVRLGAPSPYSDLSGYDSYFLSFTNTSANDFYFTSLYIKTGPNDVIYESMWYPLMPGNRVDMSLDLTLVANLSVPDLTDVREMGFGLFAYIGQGYGLADVFNVKVEGEERPNEPIPEASTLMLFGSGLAGIMAIARRKLPFLSK
ncbi:MAG: PEP-CTERM sorting domain-containing protein [bacterium]|nr:PEP-CTERM sorting domain-containing protein [bacterium]